MPFTNKDLHEALGATMLGFWQQLKAQEEAQTQLRQENEQLKEKLAEKLPEKE